MRLIDADKYKGKCICNHLYSGVTKLIEVDAIPIAFDLGVAIKRLEEKVIEELGIDREKFAMDKGEYSSYCTLTLYDVLEILKSSTNAMNRNEVRSLKYSEKAYRELYSLVGLLEKFNNSLKNEEVVPWSKDDKDKITGDIEEWSYMLKSYAKQIDDFEFVEDFNE